jgi:hypothetical protein
MEYTLKRIHADGIETAVQKADKYRELNQPEEAESICRDVLAVDPDHQLALRVLGLALTDRFGEAPGARYAEAQEVFGRLRDPYERAFYAGLASEREGKAQLARRVGVRSVLPLFEQALARYAEAETLRPPGNDDAVLRWNSCVRRLRALGPVEHDAGDDWEMDSGPRHR